MCNMNDRSLCYWSKVYTERLKALCYWGKVYTEQLKEGQKYEELEKTVTVNILDYVKFKQLHEYHNYFDLYERDLKVKLIDEFSLYEDDLKAKFIFLQYHNILLKYQFLSIFGLIF